MAFTVDGWKPEKPKAKLVGGGGPGYKPPSNLERAIAIAGDAQRGGYQAPRDLPAYIAPQAGQMNGPVSDTQRNAGNSGVNGKGVMGLRDWQQATGVYDAKVDKERDVWTPTGFGVPGVPRGNIDGLQDYYGRNIGENGVVDSIPMGGNGGGDGEVDTLSRNNKRGEQAGTQMSPAPADFDALAARIASKNPGIAFNQDYQFKNENPGSQSNSLPGTPGSMPNPEKTVTIAGGPNQGMSVYRDDPDYDAKVDGEMMIGTRETLIDGQNSTEISRGAQRGSSPAADIGDQGPQMSGRLADALNDKEGMRSYMEGIGANSNEGRDLRSEAFLNGSDDSMMALRGADLSQGYIKQNGRSYAKGADGSWGEIGAEGVQSLKDNRNSNANSQQFLDQYMKKAVTPQDQESADAVQPVGASGAQPGQLSQRDMQGTAFFENDPSKLQGIYGDTGTTGPDSRTDLTKNYFAREDVSEPGRSWLPTEGEEAAVSGGLNGFRMEEDREPLMRFN